uniref:Uncharacterized protein n=1 Tax=Rhizophora mucronata TaxID=61149 RepID=A0A2P2IUN5_RHIMU
MCFSTQTNTLKSKIPLRVSPVFDC